MVKKCIKYDCKNKASYCIEHYDKIKKESNRRGDALFWIIIIISVSLSVAWIVGYDNNKDNESNFCFDKLNTHFPEYKFKSAYSSSTMEGTDLCVGVYDVSEEPIQRDGLKQSVEVETREQSFELLNQEDIDYLHSDDFYDMVLIPVIIIIVCCFAIWYWCDKIQWR